MIELAFIAVLFLCVLVLGYYIYSLINQVEYLLDCNGNVELQIDTIHKDVVPALVDDIERYRQEQINMLVAITELKDRLDGNPEIH